MITIIADFDHFAAKRRFFIIMIFSTKIAIIFWQLKKFLTSTPDESHGSPVALWFINRNSS
jgi:hypothetical protein